MLAVFVLAPVIGLVWGLTVKRVGLGLVIGLLVGGGNFALWTAYNDITEKLGLDTVKNLLVNLGLFVVIGILVGVGAGVFAARQHGKENIQGGEYGDVAGDRPG